MLWPRISIEPAGYNLAASGAVGRNAFDEAEVALELLHYLRAEYAGRVEERYKLADTEALDDEGLLTAIGRKRGAMLGGGRVSLQKAAEVLIYEFRQGLLGRITLETPEQFAGWAATAALADQQRLEKLAARKRKTKAPQRGGPPSEAIEASEGPASE
jgi:ribosome biogenesis GTPase A